MAKAQKKRKKPVEKPAETYQPKDFLDLIAPAAVKFNTDSYVLGGLYRCVLALRGYPAVTEDLALLSHICNRAGVTLHLYARQVTAAEEDAIYHKAVNKNRLDRSSQDNLKRSVTAEANLQDVAAIIAGARKNREPLIHCAVFLELASKSPEELRRLRDEVGAELTRAKLSADPLLLRQREGFLSANPAGRNALGAQFERVLPASSTANLYPINYSGRSDPHGFYIGNDHYGSDILLDLDRRTPDKTNSSVLILGNSGEGKSYLLKLLLCNLLESGKTVNLPGSGAGADLPLRQAGRLLRGSHGRAVPHQLSGGQAVGCGHGRGPHRSPAERVRWGEEPQRNERTPAARRERGIWSLRRRQG